MARAMSEDLRWRVVRLVLETSFMDPRGDSLDVLRGRHCGQLGSVLLPHRGVTPGRRAIRAGSARTSAKPSAQSDRGTAR